MVLGCIGMWVAIVISYVNNDDKSDRLSNLVVC